MKINLISKSETSEIIKKLSKEWKMEFPKIKNLKVYHIDDNSQIISGSGIRALKTDESILPFLTEKETLEKFPYVMVDMGAVKFMCNGANVMRPGIRNHSDFFKGDIVCIIEESQKKFLAIGKAIVDSTEIETMQKGEVIKNLHYISDKFWEINKTLS